MFTQYIQNVNIELNVAHVMVARQILPAAVSYCGDLAKSNYYCEKCGTVSGIGAKMQRNIAELTDEVSDALDLLDAKHAEAMAMEKIEDKANALHSCMVNYLPALKEKVDALELAMPSDKWPIPSYSDIFDM